ncbi:MAG: DUF4383 domain-containing protein [Streptosporangiales bacterium]|nr:DUF4383 domain-containing protein [Streptosporangiales bacterium]
MCSCFTNICLPPPCVTTLTAYPLPIAQTTATPQFSRFCRRATGLTIGGGLVYLALFLYGLLIEPDSSANLVPLNTADNWLHLGLSAGMIALGAVLSRRPRPRRANTAALVPGRNAGGAVAPLHPSGGASAQP